MIHWVLELNTQVIKHKRIKTKIKTMKINKLQKSTENIFNKQNKINLTVNVLRSCTIFQLPGTP